MSVNMWSVKPAPSVLHLVTAGEHCESPCPILHTDTDYKRNMRPGICLHPSTQAKESEMQLLPKTTCLPEISTSVLIFHVLSNHQILLQIKHTRMDSLYTEPESVLSPLGDVAWVARSCWYRRLTNRDSAVNHDVSIRHTVSIAIW